METNNNVEKPYTDPKTGKFIEGNPGGGRPKGSGISITTAIKRELEKRPEGQDKSTYLDLLVKRIMKKAIQEGDQQTIKQIWNYVDGMPQQNVDLQSGGKPIFLPVETMTKYAIDPSTETNSTGLPQV
jgi:hypothetical protein